MGACSGILSARPRIARRRDDPAYLARETEKLEAPWLENVKTAEDWQKLRARYKEEYFYMLGLWPLPERTPLAAKVTGRLRSDGYVVEKLHYQSRPRLYVTGNLYRPERIGPGERLPAVFYPCGHSGQGRDGQQDGLPVSRHLVRTARVLSA